MNYVFSVQDSQRVLSSSSLLSGQLRLGELEKFVHNIQLQSYQLEGEWGKVFGLPVPFLSVWVVSVTLILTVWQTLSLIKAVVSVFPSIDMLILDRNLNTSVGIVLLPTPKEPCSASLVILHSLIPSTKLESLGWYQCSSNPEEIAGKRSKIIILN